MALGVAVEVTFNKQFMQVAAAQIVLIQSFRGFISMLKYSRICTP